MKRILCVSVALLALVASADTDFSGTTRKWTEATQALTRAVPSAVSEGMPIIDNEAFRLTVCAATGNTLSGAGTLQAYLWDNDLALWTRNPSLDLPLSVTSTSCQGAACRCQTFPDFQVGVASGRVLFASNGVTVSGGTTIVVQLKAWTKRGTGR